MKFHPSIPFFLFWPWRIDGTNRINLAYQELHLVIAAVFRKFNLYDPDTTHCQGPTLSLYDTIRQRDVDMDADLAMPAPKLGSKGVRITVH